MDDEKFYAAVAEELRTGGPIPGLWAKAFAESDGKESSAKALYIRYRVRQLILVEEAAWLAEQSIRSAAQLEEIRRREDERIQRAKAEGFTPIHGVLLFLVLLFFVLLIYREWAA